jgi:hypothetical protein
MEKLPAEFKFEPTLALAGRKYDHFQYWYSTLMKEEKMGWTL